MYYNLKCSGFRKHLYSMIIALVLTLSIYGAWSALRHGWAITWIFVVLVVLAAIYLIVAQWALRKKWAVDLSTFQWQSAPIAAGAMLMGWTTYTEDLAQESNAILLAVGGVYILFSSITLAESFHPERREEHGDYYKKSQSKRICLFVQIFLIQGVLAFLLGLLVAHLDRCCVLRQCPLC